MIMGGGDSGNYVPTWNGNSSMAGNQQPYAPSFNLAAAPANTIKGVPSTLPQNPFSGIFGNLSQQVTQPMASISVQPMASQPQSIMPQSSPAPYSQVSNNIAAGLPATGQAITQMPVPGAGAPMAPVAAPTAPQVDTTAIQQQITSLQNQQAQNQLNQPDAVNMNAQLGSQIAALQAQLG